MRWWSRRRPRCCSKAENRTVRNTSEKPWTQLFMAPLRVCAANSADEIPGLFAEIEARSPLANSRRDSSATSAEAALSRRPKLPAEREGQPLAWFGIYERSYVFDHATGEFVGGEPPELGSNFEPQAERSANRRFRSERSARNHRGVCAHREPNTPSASPQFTSGFAPATSISSTSPRLFA